MLNTLRMRALALCVVLPGTAAAQSLDATPAQVLDELRRLRIELDQTRSEIRQLRTELDQIKKDDTEPDSGAAPSLLAVVEMLQSQVAEQAQAKVESESRLPVKVFGTIHSVAAFNTGEANWLESPNIVGAPQRPTGSFSATARQTRLGIRTEGLSIGQWQASGAAVFDFFGGVPAFQTGQVMGLPRLVYAYARFEHGDRRIQAGQDHMILAPRNPTSLAAYSFPLLFRSGNLYLQVPQVRVESRLAGKPGAELRAVVGLIAPIAGDVSGAGYSFVPPALAGERSRLPGVQAHVSWQHGTAERGASFGLSGHYSRERQADASQPSWATAVDFDLQGARLGLTGEGFVGRNLDAFGGALGQPTGAAGGFLEARVLAAQHWDVVFGGEMDKPDDRPALMRNVSAFGSITFHPVPEVATSFEYRWLETTAASTLRRNHHLNWAMTYSF